MTGVMPYNHLGTPRRGHQKVYRAVREPVFRRCSLGTFPADALHTEKHAKATHQRDQRPRLRNNLDRDIVSAGVKCSTENSVIADLNRGAAGQRNETLIRESRKDA